MKTRDNHSMVSSTHSFFSFGLFGSIFLEESMFWGFSGLLAKVVTCLNLTLETFWPRVDGKGDKNAVGELARNDLIALFIFRARFPEIAIYIYRFDREINQ